MDAGAEASEKGNEEKTAAVGLVVPPQRRPDDDGGDEDGEGVDLTLNGREPGSVAEEVAEGADEGGEVGSECASVFLSLRKFRECEEDCPVEEHYRQPSCDGGKGVAATRHSHHVATRQPGEGMGQQLVEGRSRGVSHLQQVGDGDELATVPEADGRLEGEEVDRRGDDGQQPADDQPDKPVDYQFTTDLLKMSSHSSLTISLTSEASTAEKSREAS